MRHLSVIVATMGHLPVATVGYGSLI
jgi:hypothetical protein